MTAIVLKGDVVYINHMVIFIALFISNYKNVTPLTAGKPCGKLG